MAKVMVPVIGLKYDEAFNLDALDVFEQEGLHIDDEFTYTMRVAALEDGQRERVCDKLRERLPEEQAQRLIALLDEHEWDISFFVDCF